MARLHDRGVGTAKHASMSNWCDNFKNIVDLKGLVLKRLTEQFPGFRASLALHPDRVVRMALREWYLKEPNGIGDWLRAFTNVGVGPAFNLEYGYVLADGGQIVVGSLGGLAEKNSMPEGGSRTLFNIGYWGPVNGKIEADSVSGLYCEYENRFGDRYRVVAPMTTGSRPGVLQRKSNEEFYIAKDGIGTPKAQEWVRVV